jgi:hypothetical protein
MVTKSWLVFEAFNSCMGSLGRTLSTDEFDVLLSVGKDIHVLNNEDAFHDNKCLTIYAKTFGTNTVKEVIILKLSG